MVAVGVSSMPQAALRSVTLLLYALSLGSLSKVLWARLCSKPWPLGTVPLLQLVQKTASVSAAAVLLHGVAVWLQDALHARTQGTGALQRQAQRIIQQYSSAQEVSAVQQHRAAL